LSRSKKSQAQSKALSIYSALRSQNNKNKNNNIILFFRFNFISQTEAKGLNTFVGTFSLPALIFGSLCKLNIMSVNWTFLIAILIAKSVIFFVVLIGTFFVGQRAWGKAGLYAIFTTQSNDFALGYPILKAVYGLTHPDYPAYLYLLAPISLVILNPIGFIFMEIGHQESNPDRSRWKTVKGVAKGVATNPIIFMTVLGVIGNFVFKGTLPDFIDGFLASLGAAFSASALFLLGLRMVSKPESAFKV
jgi:predicted permease